jgi:hypothetical protein
MLSEICTIQQNQTLDSISIRVRRIFNMNIKVTGDEKLMRCSRSHMKQNLKVIKELKERTTERAVSRDFAEERGCCTVDAVNSKV